MGLGLARKLFHKSLGYDGPRNDQVTSFMSVLVLFYGITIGLVAVGTWENLSQVEEKVAREAASLAALYRDISSFPEPDRSELKRLLKKYTRYTIDVAWPLQQKAIQPKDGVAILNEFQDVLYGTKPSDKKDEILLGETLCMYNDFVTLRRMRLMSVNGGLPGIIWMVIIVGALLTISFLWFFVMEQFWPQNLMTVLVSIFIGTMIFLIAIMDHPFRGKLSVDAQPFEMVYTNFIEIGE